MVQDEAAVRSPPLPTATRPGASCGIRCMHHRLSSVTLESSSRAQNGADAARG
jgi:hypothetical protein